MKVVHHRFSSSGEYLYVLLSVRYFFLISSQALDSQRIDLFYFIYLFRSQFCHIFKVLLTNFSWSCSNTVGLIRCLLRWTCVCSTRCFRTIRINPLGYLKRQQSNTVGRVLDEESNRLADEAETFRGNKESSGLSVLEQTGCWGLLGFVGNGSGLAVLWLITGLFSFLTIYLKLAAGCADRKCEADRRMNVLPTVLRPPGVCFLQHLLHIRPFTLLRNIFTHTTHDQVPFSLLSCQVPPPCSSPLVFPGTSSGFTRPGR